MIPQGNDQDGWQSHKGRQKDRAVKNARDSSGPWPLASEPYSAAYTHRVKWAIQLTIKVADALEAAVSLISRCHNHVDHTRCQPRSALLPPTGWSHKSDLLNEDRCAIAQDLSRGPLADHLRSVVSDANHGIRANLLRVFEH